MSAIYPKWKEQLLQFTANNNISTGTVKAALVSSTYVYSAAHQFFSSVTGQVGTSVIISGGTKSYTNGAFDTTTDPLFTAVTGSQVTGIIVYIDTGVAGTSPLVAYIDSASAGLPVTPNGGDITVVWNASGIFTL